MNQYVFEFSINGDVDLYGLTKEGVEHAVQGFPTEKLLELSNGHCLTLKCIGTRNEDDSITYFEKDKE